MKSNFMMKHYTMMTTLALAVAMPGLSVAPAFAAAPSCGALTNPGNASTATYTATAGNVVFYDYPTEALDQQNDYTYNGLDHQFERTAKLAVRTRSSNSRNPRGFLVALTSV